MRRLCFIMSLSVLFSCKKDKLVGEMDVLIGTWNWTYTNHIYGICDGESYTETLTPESEGEAFSMELFENGIIKFYQNGDILARERLAVAQFGEPCKGSFEEYSSFDFHLNNNNKDQSAHFGGCVNLSELVVLYGLYWSNIFGQELKNN